ncbi:MAG: DM13 domain-containing protein [Cyanobacteriota bacterium]
MKKSFVILNCLSASLIFSCMPMNNSPMSMPNKISTTDSSMKTDPKDLMVLKMGNFQNSVHKVSGGVKLIKNGEKHQVMLVDFNTEAGPDLHVYLVKNDIGDASKADSFLNLGKLALNSGNMNVDIPSGINLNDYKSISIWCKAFNVNFGFSKIN